MALLVIEKTESIRTIDHYYYGLKLRKLPQKFTAPSPFG